MLACEYAAAACATLKSCMAASLFVLVDLPVDKRENIAQEVSAKGWVVVKVVSATCFVDPLTRLKKRTTIHKRADSVARHQKPSSPET